MLLSTNKRSSSSYFCLEKLCTLKYICQGCPSWGITILLILSPQLFCTKIDNFAIFVQIMAEIPLSLLFCLYSWMSQDLHYKLYCFLKKVPIGSKWSILDSKMIHPHNSGSVPSISFNFAQLNGPRGMTIMLIFSLVQSRSAIWPKDGMPQWPTLRAKYLSVMLILCI